MSMPPNRAFDRPAAQVLNRAAGDGGVSRNAHMPRSGETEARQALVNLVNALARHNDVLVTQLPTEVIQDLAEAHRAASDAYAAWRPSWRV